MDTKQDRKKRVVKIALLVLTLPVLFAGLNFQQLYSVWTVRSETQRLAKLAGDTPDDFENPAPLIEDFEEGLSTAFWDFTIINGAGQVSNETAWHAAEMVIDHQLILRHGAPPVFHWRLRRRGPARSSRTPIVIEVPPVRGPENALPARAARFSLAAARWPVHKD